MQGGLYWQRLLWIALYTQELRQKIKAQSQAQRVMAAKRVEDRAVARKLQQAATISDEEPKQAESSDQELVKLRKQLNEKETELSKVLSDKEMLEAYTRQTLQKFQEESLAALQDCMAKLKEEHDKINRSQTRLLARPAQVEAILASKDEQIKAAAAKDEKILTLETALQRKDQELALKDKEVRSKDEKIAVLEGALKNCKPIDVVDLISHGNLDITNESTGPPLKRPRMDHGEVHPKSFLQSIVRVQEEMMQTVETALADARDDLGIEKDTITQQEIFLTAWMKKFDELADIARNTGVDGALLKSIRDRSVLWMLFYNTEVSITSTKEAWHSGPNILDPPDNY